MRNSFPVRPLGTHTWIAARFMPTDHAIIYKCNGHVIVYAHPESPWTLSQKMVHHLVALSRSMLEGDVRTEVHAPDGPLQSLNPRFARNLVNYINRSTDPREQPVFLAAYGVLHDRLPPATAGYLRDNISQLLAA